MILLEETAWYKSLPQSNQTLVDCIVYTAHSFKDEPFVKRVTTDLYKRSSASTAPLIDTGTTSTATSEQPQPTDPLTVLTQDGDSSENDANT